MNVKKGKVSKHWKCALCTVLMLSAVLMPATELPSYGGSFGFNTSVTAVSYTYYPKCASSYNSLVDALKSVGVDASYSNRQSIAKMNDINNYTGTAAQNTTLLNLLKQGKLVKSKTNDNSGVTYYPKCASSYNSLVDALKSVGVDASYNNRQSIAKMNNISNYTGTAAQNTTLLNLLKQGKLVKSKSSSGNTVAVTGVSLSPNTSFSLSVGATKQLNATVKPTNATNKNVTWNSSNTSVATVSTSGLVKAKKVGTAKITVKTSNGKTASVNVNVVSGSNIITNSKYNVSVSNPAKENQPHYENTSAAGRSASAYNKVINQFNVQSNKRYQPASGKTYCNIFAWDVMSAMNVSLPHWIKNNKPATSNTSGANELNANAVYNWLQNYGSSYGWSKVNAYDAQKRANSGYPTIAIWKNPSGASGHVAVVRPEGNGYTYTTNNGPVIAQAGGSNYNYCNVKTGFGSNKMNAIVYWTHA